MNHLPLLTEPAEKTAISSPLKKRSHLKIRIIKYLYQEGTKSIPDLCTITRVSSPTLKRLLDELEEEGLVVELGLGASGGGRRPSIYGLNPNSRFILGIDITRFELRMGLFNLSCSMIGELLIIPDGLETGADITKLINKNIAYLIKKNKIDKKKILGAGVALPGLIDIKTGISYSYLNQGNTPVAEYLQKDLGMPVFVEHDTRSMARGELMFGLAKGKKNVLCLNLGSGIGLSMILNGRVYSGESGYAGEFGHINVDPHGQLCYCGKIGCLETVASGRTLRKKVADDLKAGTPTIINQLIDNDPAKINMKIILEAVFAGDQYANELIATTGVHLGKGIATLLHLFNPELIILGGTLSKAENILLDPIQQTLNSFSIPRIRQDTTLLTSELRENAGLMGTVALVMDKVFETGQS
ncbi:MAG: ROK family protein [Bacteroidales bacterium]